MNELNGYRPIFKNYIRANRLLSKGCLEELEKLQNFFFAYNLSNDELRRCEDYMAVGDYMILFSINLYNNSLIFKIYGKIDTRKITQIKEKIIKILTGEKFDLNTFGYKKLFEKQKVLVCELNFFGERCTPLFKEKILNKVKSVKVADRILGEAVEPFDVIKAIENNESIATITRCVLIPETGEINVYVNLFASANKIHKIKDDLDAIMLGFMLYTEFYKTTFVPFTGQSFTQYQICYTNIASCI